jgi:hypothetical protein
VGHRHGYHGPDDGLMGENFLPKSDGECSVSIVNPLRPKLCFAAQEATLLYAA